MINLRKTPILVNPRVVAHSVACETGAKLKTLEIDFLKWKFGADLIMDGNLTHAVLNSSLVHNSLLSGDL